MKVYTRKKEYQSPIIGLLILTVFLAVSFFIFGSYLAERKINPYAWLDYLIPLSFALVFLPISIGGLLGFLKKPVAYQAKLIKKTITKYNGREITLMEFEALLRNENVESVPNKYKCFTYDTSDLLENEDYAILIKEFNWQIISVEELDSYASRHTVKKIPPVSNKLIFWCVCFIFANIGVCSIGNIVKNTKLAFIYIFPLLFSIITVSRNDTLA